jgi:hypothetical protein
MKTAVEWLETRAEERESNNPNESAYWHLRELIKDFEKAKEMELHQHQEDTNYGYSQGWDDGNQNKEPMKPELKQQEQ